MEFRGIVSIDDLITKDATEKSKVGGVGSTVGGLLGGLFGGITPIPGDEIIFSWLGSKAGDWIESKFTKPTNKDEAQSNLEKARELYKQERTS